MENITAITSWQQQRHQHVRGDFGTLSDLGEYIYKINALLRAAGDIGSGERDDKAWLRSVAWDAAFEMKKRYMEWAVGPAEAAGEPECGV
jgi:hypothetical protein